MRAIVAAAGGQGRSPGIDAELFWIGQDPLATRQAMMGHGVAPVAGATLYPLMLALTALLRESPTSELMICRKGHACAQS